MRRQTLTVWFVLCVLLGISIALPLDHTCLGKSAAGLHRRVDELIGEASSGLGGVAARAAVGQAPSLVPADEDTVCLGCVWAQSLLPGNSEAESFVADDPGAPVHYSAEVPTASAESFQVNFKRGPPSSTAV